MTEPALSFVIPLYDSAATIGEVVREIETLTIEGGHEIVLVNDGSRDATAEVCRRLVATARLPITFVDHARNYGEHNAVLSGYRQARGAYVVNLDDDGQNPPAEAKRLYEHARAHRLDAVFGCYRDKRHAGWRNLGSRFANRITDLLLDKPRGFYLSSFRCVSALVAKQVAAHEGPFPYVDGLILQVTQRIEALTVRHADRVAGRSGYDVRRLVRLWISSFVNFSAMPLRASTVLGLLLALAGGAATAFVLAGWLRAPRPELGWAAILAALLLLSGVQLLMLGLMGEYLGRMFLAVNRRPQSVVREVLRGGGPPAPTDPD